MFFAPFSSGFLSIIAVPQKELIGLAAFLLTILKAEP